MKIYKAVYPYGVKYRRRYPNTFKMQTVRLYEKDGREVLRTVNGKPYYDRMISIFYCRSEAEAQRYIDIKKRKGTGGYFKILDGPFEVEESYL